MARGAVPTALAAGARLTWPQVACAGTTVSASRAIVAASSFGISPVSRRYPSNVASRRQIDVGGVKIGGGAPVAVQSMTKTETADYDATLKQVRAIADAGADLVRVAVPREKDVEALKRLVVESPIPVIADIHFNHTLALKAIDAGAHCVRLNPGNIGGPEKVAEVAKRATAAGVPMRIGVNSGSLPKHLHELERENPVEALVTAAVEFVELMERLDFENFKVSIKSTSVPEHDRLEPPA